MVTRENSHDDKMSQADKFKQAANGAECDEDEARWTERLKKVAKPKVASVPDKGA